MATLDSTTLLGQPAPDFSLSDADGKTWSLATLLGAPAVFIFYPGDMTPGCTVQLCAVRDDWAKFSQAGIKVFGINQGSAKSHTTFQKAHSFPFPLLIDSKKEMAEAYGAIMHILGLKLIRRTVVAIDETGKVVYFKAGMPKNADILKVFNVK